MVRGNESPSLAACKGESSRSSPTVEDERQTELAVEVEVDSRVCRCQKRSPSHCWNRGVEQELIGQLLHSQK